MKHPLFLLLLLMLGQPAAAAINEGAFIRCANMEIDSERLSCFDQLAEKNDFLDVGAEELEATTPGEWQREEPDADTTTLTLHADSGSTNGEQLPTLSITCSENEAQLSINWQDFLGGKDVVLSRMGLQDAEFLEWRRGSDDQTTYLGDAPLDFVRNMLASERLLVQAVPFGEDPLTAVFNLRGMDAALLPLREQCGLSD